MGSRWTFSEATVTPQSGAQVGTNFKGSVAYELEPLAPALGLTVQLTRRHSWGARATADFQFQRQIKSVDASFAASTPSTSAFLPSSGTAGLLSGGLSLDGLYRWNQQSLFFGLDYRQLSLSNPPAALAGQTLATFGFEVGSGFQFSERFGVELAAKFDAGVAQTGSVTSTVASQKVSSSLGTSAPLTSLQINVVWMMGALK